jgi:hypothetical protein
MALQSEPRECPLLSGIREISRPAGKTSLQNRT